MTQSPHSAPGANAGFAYQFERALLWLAQSQAGALIGIETDDDVAVRGPNSERVMEQDKHSVREAAKPFGDRSKDLWNTLAIWIEALDAKEVDPEATRFLMVTNKTLPACIAKQIADADSEQKISACITALKAASVNPPKQIASLVKRVLRPESLANLRSLIKHCDVADASDGTAGAGLRAATIACLPLPQCFVKDADSIVNELLGWLHKTVLEAWQQRVPAWVARDNFVNQIYAVTSRRQRQISRERAEHLIPVDEKVIGQNRGSPFVKQLHLVTDDDALVDGSIRDLIRCNIEKARLSAEGNITDDDWKGFEVALQSRWERIRARLIRMKRNSPESDVGFEILTDTTEKHCEKLAGAETEQVYLTAGTYHRLADMIRVGWHPRFKELMSQYIKSP